MIRYKKGYHLTVLPLLTSRRWDSILLNKSMKTWYGHRCEWFSIFGSFLLLGFYDFWNMLSHVSSFFNQQGKWMFSNVFLITFWCFSMSFKFFLFRVFIFPNVVSTSFQWFFNIFNVFLKFSLSNKIFCKKKYNGSFALYFEI